MAKVVTYVKAHSDIFAPGIGSLGITLPPANKSIKLKMILNEENSVITVETDKGVKFALSSSGWYMACYQDEATVIPLHDKKNNLPNT